MQIWLSYQSITLQARIYQSITLKSRIYQSIRPPKKALKHLNLCDSKSPRFELCQVKWYHVPITGFLVETVLHLKILKIKNGMEACQDNICLIVLRVIDSGANNINRCSEWQIVPHLIS
jgi:hypothetical protein